MMKHFILSLITLSLITACNQDHNKPYSDTTTYGTVALASDETLKPLSDAQSAAFMGLYKYAKLNLKTVPEASAFDLLLKDSVKAIMSTRKLRKEEEAVFKKRNLYPVTTKVAIDGLALIINRNNPDSLMTLTQLKNILSGRITSWKQINSKSPSDNLNLVFDNNGSSTVRYLKDSLLEGKSFSENCFAAKGNKEVIDYVESHPEAIGVIGVSWISDSHDENANAFRDKIHVVWLSVKDAPVWPDDYFQPYQAYIALKQYPLVREVYMINREGRAGLGTGFVSFVAGEQGQRIVRLSGLLPATMPVRLIQN